MLKFLKSLFASDNGSKQQPSNSATAPLNENQLFEITGKDHSSSLAQHMTGSALDIGKRRENNEDALLSISGTLGVETQAQPFGLYAVADGMGGHRNGEVASETALRALGGYVISKLYQPLFGPNPGSIPESLKEIMEAGVRDAHREIQKAAPGGGCTLTAALILGNQLVIAHLGDSRAYAIYQDGRMEALTRDHTLVQRLKEMGQLSAEEAAAHPQKSVLYRALGQGQHIDVDMIVTSMPQAASLLICSDGLWGVVDEDEIQQIVGATASPYLACRRLVEAANAAGGPDNISIVLVRALD